MYFTLSKSPKSNKKYRVITPQGIIVDFGAKGFSDYTIHKNPMRMLLYVQRHGGKIPKQLKEEVNYSKVQKKMLKIKTSSKENWTKTGLNTAGFWSRWLLWSYPNIKNAKKIIETKFGIKIRHV